MFYLLKKNKGFRNAVIRQNRQKYLRDQKIIFETCCQGDLIFPNCRIFLIMSDQ